MNNTQENNLDTFFTPRTKRVRRTKSSPELVEEGTPKKKKAISEEMAGTTGNKELIEMMGQLLDSKLNEIATKTDVEKINNSIAEFLAEISYLKEEVMTLKKENNDLKERISLIEKRSRENNLIFKGIPSGPPAEDSVKEICSNVLGIKEPLLISKAFNIAKKNNPQIILTQFALGHQIDKILQNTAKLKNTGITILRDYPVTIRNRQKNLLILRRTLMNKKIAQKIKVREDKMSIGDCVFHWSEEEGLLYNKENGNYKIKEMTGVEVGDVVAALLQGKYQLNGVTGGKRASSVQGISTDSRKEE